MLGFDFHITVSPFLPRIPFVTGRARSTACPSCVTAFFSASCIEPGNPRRSKRCLVSVRMPRVLSVCQPHFASTRLLSVCFSVLCVGVHSALPVRTCELNHIAAVTAEESKLTQRKHFNGSEKDANRLCIHAGIILDASLSAHISVSHATHCALQNVLECVHTYAHRQRCSVVPTTHSRKRSTLGCSDQLHSFHRGVKQPGPYRPVLMLAAWVSFKSEAASKNCRAGTRQLHQLAAPVAVTAACSHCFARKRPPLLVLSAPGR